MESGKGQILDQNSYLSMQLCIYIDRHSVSSATHSAMYSMVYKLHQSICYYYDCGYLVAKSMHYICMLVCLGNRSNGQMIFT